MIFKQTKAAGLVSGNISPAHGERLCETKRVFLEEDATTRIYVAVILIAVTPISNGYLYGCNFSRIYTRNTLPSIAGIPRNEVAMYSQHNSCEPINYVAIKLCYY